MKLVLVIAITMALACFTNAAAYNPPEYRQGDSKWGSKQLGFGSYTIKQKGCFLTAQTSMIASQGILVDGEVPNPDNMNEYFKDNDCFDGGMLFYKAPEKFGFGYEGFVTSKSEILQAFDEGKFVLLHVEHGSHWVLVTGHDSTGYTVMDPAGVRTSYKYSEVPEVVVYTAPEGAPGHSGQASEQPAPEPTPETENEDEDENEDENENENETETETPSSSSSSSPDDSWAAEALDANNKWRSAVGVPDLVWNKTLAASAQAWADNIARSGSSSHSQNRDNIGENIAYGSTNTNSITDLIDLWGEESEDFVAGRPYPECSRGSQSDVWHYTQMVWKKTTQLGCGLGERNGRSYLVCQYYPRGNMRGQIVF